MSPPNQKTERPVSASFQEMQLAVIGSCTMGIVHDLNNMLAVVQGQSELLVNTETLSTRGLKMMGDVLAATARARDLSRSVIGFTRPTIGQAGPTDGIKVIHEDLPLIRAAAPTVVELRHRLAEQCPRVKLPATHLHRILMNLTLNAIDALSGKAGYILIEAEGGGTGPDPAFILRVSDSGPGMDTTTKSEIFNPYFSTRSREHRSGIGLVNVANLVLDANGTIAVDSAPGCGATFTVTLPGIYVDADTPVDFPWHPQESSPLRILYVDDEPDVVRIQRSTLRSMGHVVTCITDAYEADRHFKMHAETFDLVITDACMPGLSGLALAQRVKAQRPQVPIILLTGSHEAATAGYASPCIEHVLMKPVPPMDLDACIRKYTGPPVNPAAE